MTEGDVQRFAATNGLPQDYVQPFFSGMSAQASRTGNVQQGQVPYHVFHSFVSSRERALRRIFDTLDKGKCTFAFLLQWPQSCF